MQSQIENYRAKAKEFARLMIVAKSLRHSANIGNWLRCIGRSHSARNLIAPSLKDKRQKERNMTTYPVEFHRRLEQKWATRIDQILIVAANAIPPREPNGDDDEENEEDEEDEEDEERDDEPPVVREPERDE